MAKFSSRLDWPASSNALAQMLQRRWTEGAEILDLTESNPTRAGIPYASAEILAALPDPRSLTYEPSAQGLEIARAAVARAYGYHPERLVLTSSTSEAYSWLFKLLCDPGDEVLVPRPSYPLFEYLTSLESVRVRQYPLRYHEGWWIDFEALEPLVGPRTRAIVIVHPNNPTGSYLKRLEFDRLASIRERAGCTLISDEVFAEYALCDDVERMGTLGCQERVPAFALGGLSKSCGLPQMKLGWIAAAGPIAWRAQALDRLELIADTFLPASAPVQYAAPRWLELRSGFQQAVLERLRANIEATPEALRVEGGWNAVIRLPRTRSEETWALGLLEERAVLIQPGYFYDFETEAFAVVSLLTEPVTYREGLARLREYIDVES